MSTSTTQDGTQTQAVGLFTCPAAVPMDIFVQKCEEIMDAVLTLPVAEKLVRYEMVCGDSWRDAS